MRTVRFTIPGKPMAKGRPKASGRFGVARVYTDKKDLDREKLIRTLARQAMGRQAPFPWAVQVIIDAVFEIPPSWPSAKRNAARDNIHHTQKPDGDNIAKSVLDGLVPGKDDEHLATLFDDTQVAVLIVRKRWGSPERTDVTVEELEALAPVEPRAAEPKGKRLPPELLL